MTSYLLEFFHERLIHEKDNVKSPMIMLSSTDNAVCLDKSHSRCLHAVGVVNVHAYTFNVSLWCMIAFTDPFSFIPRSHLFICLLFRHRIAMFVDSLSSIKARQRISDRYMTLYLTLSVHGASWHKQ